MLSFYKLYYKQLLGDFLTTPLVYRYLTTISIITRHFMYDYASWCNVILHFGFCFIFLLVWPLFQFWKCFYLFQYKFTSLIVTYISKDGKSNVCFLQSFLSANDNKKEDQTSQNTPSQSANLVLTKCFKNNCCIIPINLKLSISPLR